MGIFGASLLPSAAFADGKRREPAPEFKPRKRTLAENLGLLADAFHGNDRHRRLLMEQDEQDRAQWMAQLQRAQDFADFTRKYDYQVAHPKPQQPTPFERDLMAAGIDPKSARGQALYQQKVTNAATAPPIVQRNVDGTYSVYPMGTIPQGGAAPKTLGATLPPGWTVGGAPSQGGATFP